jgi:hypothetical protein
MDDRKDPMTRVVEYLRHNALAAIALVCSLLSMAGASYAALSLPAGSVGTRQLRNGSVTNSKIARHAVTAANLDPKSIAGHIADWAQIRANGQVVSSSPRASVFATDPARGLFQVSWHRGIPSSCIAIANPANVAPVLGPATADTFGPNGRGLATSLLVETFNSNGANVPENVNVVVICP